MANKKSANKKGLGPGERIVAQAKIGQDNYIITDKPSWTQMKVRIRDPKPEKFDTFRNTVFPPKGKHIVFIAKDGKITGDPTKADPDKSKMGMKGVRAIWGIRKAGGTQLTAMRFQKKPKFAGQRVYTADSAKDWIESHPTLFVRSPEETKRQNASIKRLVADQAQDDRNDKDTKGKGPRLL